MNTKSNNTPPYDTPPYDTAFERKVRRGEILRQARKAAGLTQEDAAKATGVGTSTLRAFEVEADRVPAPDVAERLAGVLRMRPTELAAVLGYVPDEDLEILRQAWEKRP